MTLPREALGARLRPLLSETAGRGCVELLTLAGLPSGRGYAQTAAVALNELVAKGLARREKPYGHGPQFFAVPAPAAASEERVELPELDATLTLTATTARPFGAPTDRTTLAITCTLGPSWPEGVHVPGWSTGLFASQVTQGGLSGARANDLARMRAVLSTLRADPTRDLSPAPPEVPVSDNETISALLAYCAGVSGGAKDSSVHSWLKARRVSRIRAEELLEQLVSEGRLRLVERPIAGGEVVLRYLPAESVEPAPLPRSDAPPEETSAPSEEAPAPIEEPVMVAGAPESCQGCEARSAELARISSWLEKVRSDRDAARVMADLYGEAICGLVPDLRGASPVRLAEGLEDLVRDLRQERDQLADTLGIRTSERDELALRLDRTEDHRYYLAQLAGLDGGAEWSAVRPAIARALQEASTPRPAVDGGAVAQYLLTLPGDHWSALATARQQLAQAREMAHAAQLLEASALATVDQILSAPAGAQAPAPVAPEPRVDLVPPPPPPSGEQPAAGGTMADRALEFFQAHPTEGLRAQQLADALGGDRQSWTVPLSQLTTRGEIERVERGVYRLARKSRRAA